MPVPSAWSDFTRAFAELAGQRRRAGENTRRWREEVLATIAAQRQRLQTPPALALPRGTPPGLSAAVEGAVRDLRRLSGRLLEDLQATLDDFEHAAENEDRFVLLVFGEVNAGKSALANHLSGGEFGLPPESCGRCFVGDIDVPRLEEAPIECTRAYQGFRLPGLLWIDCPGVLSTTFATGELARRLVARADFVLFVTSSDAPLRTSEVRELERVIRASGNDNLEGVLVVTKSDNFLLDEDPETETLVRTVVPKSDEDRRRQTGWAREQIEQTGLGPLVQFREPLALSVFVARQALGLDWGTARPLSCPDPDWRDAYETAGLPELCRSLTVLVREHGGRLKEMWPRKRWDAIQRKLTEASEEYDGRLQELRTNLGEQRQALTDAEPWAADDAAGFAAGEVRRVLKGRLREPRPVNLAAVQGDLQALLGRSVQRAVREKVEPLLGRALGEIDRALLEFGASSAFDLDVRRKTRQHTYPSTARPLAVGGAVGGARGALVGGVVGAVLFGPLGSVVGAALGAVVGNLGGAQAAALIWQEQITVAVPAGDNADEVIARTQDHMRAQATQAVAAALRRLDEVVFAPLDEEIARLQAEVRRWPLDPRR